MLRTLINESHNRLRFYRTQTNAHRQQLTTQLNEDDAQQLGKTIAETSTAYRFQRRNNLEEKLRNTRSYQDQNTNINDWVKNISNRQLTAIEIQVLSKGMSFNTKDADPLDFIAELESYLTTSCDLSEESKNDIRQEITNGLLRHNNKTKLDKREQEALQNLQKDDTIIILPADKGRQTVVMNKDDYIKKATTLLEDGNTYTELNADPTKTTTTRINNQLKKLKDQHKLSSNLYHRIRPSDANIAKFYGLPKIHKPAIPLRPIVSLPGSPTYNLAKHLSNILKPLTKPSTRSIDNINTFLSHIENLKIKPDETMVSFDVVSLFKSIPLDIAKSTTERLLWQNISWKEHTTLEVEDIMSLLDILSTDSFLPLTSS